MISILSLSLIFSISLLVLTTQPVFAQSAELECPENSGNFSLVNGSAIYEEINYDEETYFTILYCAFEATGEIEGLPFGDIYAIYNYTGVLTSEDIVGLECGKGLGEQFYFSYVTSTTHFASVAFSTPELVIAASQLMTQIEDQNLSVVCTEEQLEYEEAQLEAEELDEEELQEEIEEEPEFAQITIEITNQAIKEKPIEEIIEVIKEFEKNEQENIEQEKIVIELDENEKLSKKIVFPDWVKSNALWWSTDQITDDEFSKGIEYLINNGVIKVPLTDAATKTSTVIPGWVKNNADWWYKGQITQTEFVNAIQFLISNGNIIIARN